MLDVFCNLSDLVAHASSGQAKLVLIHTKLSKTQLHLGCTVWDTHTAHAHDSPVPAAEPACAPVALSQRSVLSFFHPAWLSYPAWIPMLACVGSLMILVL